MHIFCPLLWPESWLSKFTFLSQHPDRMNKFMRDKSARQSEAVAGLARAIAAGEEAERSVQISLYCRCILVYCRPFPDTSGLVQGCWKGSVTAHEVEEGYDGGGWEHVRLIRLIPSIVENDYSGAELLSSFSLQHRNCQDQVLKFWPTFNFWTRVLVAEKLLTAAIAESEDCGITAIGVAKPDEDVNARLVLERLRLKRARRWVNRRTRGGDV